MRPDATQTYAKNRLAAVQGAGKSIERPLIRTNHLFRRQLIRRAPPLAVNGLLKIQISRDSSRIGIKLLKSLLSALDFFRGVNISISYFLVFTGRHVNDIHGTDTYYSHVQQGSKLQRWKSFIVS